MEFGVIVMLTPGQHKLIIGTNDSMDDMLHNFLRQKIEYLHSHATE